MEEQDKQVPPSRTVVQSETAPEVRRGEDEIKGAKGEDTGTEMVPKSQLT